MNKTKRNLIIAAGIINLIDIVCGLALVILYRINPTWLQEYANYFLPYCHKAWLATMLYLVNVVKLKR